MVLRPGRRHLSQILDRRVLAPCVEERLGPALPVLMCGEPVVDRSPRGGREVAALVVSEQEVRQDEVAAAAQDWFRVGKRRRRVEPGGVTADALQHLRTAFTKQSLVNEVRARPHPQIAAVGSVLICEQDASQQSERRRRVLPGTMTVDVWPSWYVVPWAHRGCNLNVVEGEIEAIRRNQLLGDIERP